MKKGNFITQHSQTALFLLPVLLTIILFLYTNYLLMMPAIERNMIEVRKDNLKEMTNSACNLLNHYNEFVLIGELSVEKAQELAKERLRKIRFGINKNDYYWINTTEPRLIMHPFLESYEGKWVDDFKGPDGTLIFHEILKTVNDTVCYLKYRWFFDNDSSKIYTKISHVQLFEPWGWIVGAGIYEEEQNMHFNAIKRKLNYSVGGIFIILLIISGSIIIRATRLENRRRLAENALFQREQQFKAIFNGSFQYITLLEPDGTLTAANDSALKFINKSIFNIYGKKFWETPWWDHSSDEQEKLKNGIEKCNQGDFVRFETFFINQDHHKVEIDFSILPIIDNNGNISKLLAEGRDIGNLKEIEYNLKEQNEEYEAINEELVNSNIQIRKLNEEIRKNESKYRSYIDNAPNGLFIFNGNGNIIEVNSMASRLTGMSVESLTKQNLTNIFNSDPFNKDTQFIEKLKKRGKISIELSLQQEQQDSPIMILFEAVKLFDDKYLGFAIDITHQKNTEKELIEAKNHAEESDKLKSSFLANMSHEIRTPMNGIIGFARMLDKDDLTAEQKQECINIINSSSSQLLTIITDILDISKIEANQIALKTVDININEMMDELGSIFEAELKNRNKKEVSMIVSKPYSDKESVVKTDQVRLRQILYNLIDNAIKFTFKGSVEIGYNFQNDKKVLFYIKDTGMGIAKENQKLVFERFRQLDDSHERKAGGTGLGLSICKGLVELFGGEIWLESEPGLGTAFYFTLPVEISQTKHTKHNKAISKNIYTWPGKTILIAEDVFYNFRYVSMILNHTDIDIIHAANGKEALEAIHTNEKINLVLMDIQMPIMNGYDATVAIKAVRPDLPIIAQTAYALAEDVQKCMDCGCNDYISKPIDPDILLRKIDQYL